MKQVMIRAWEIVREAVKNFGGKCMNYMSKALKIAWNEFKTMMNELKIQKLIKMGAKRWTAYGKDRLYFNKAGYELVGLRYDYNKKGRIEQAYVNDEEISNNFAGKVKDSVYTGYLNLQNNKIHLCGDNYTDIDGIKQILIKNLKNL